MAASAGALVATAVAALLPEAIDQTSGNSTLVGSTAIGGFVLFAALHQFVHSHHQHRRDDEQQPGQQESLHRQPPAISLVPVAGIILHTLLDGVALGVGFRASQELGVAVGLAVAAHGAADGVSIVTLALATGRGRHAALMLLVLGAFAPPAGAVMSGNLGQLTSGLLGILLAFFTGVFLMIGGTHLLPEAWERHRQRRLALLLAFTAGAGLVLVAQSLVGQFEGSF